MTFVWSGHDIFSGVYTNMWDRLKHWQFDLDPGVLLFEAYMKDGKAYPYWGPFPALFRGFIEIFLPRGDQNWSRLSCWLAAMVIVCGFMKTFFIHIERKAWQERTKIFAAAIVGACLVLSSPIPLLLNVAFVYNEAILWALAWAAVYIAVFLGARTDAISWRRFVLLTVCATFSVLSRVSVATALIAHAGMVFITTLVPLRWQEKIPQRTRWIFSTSIATRARWQLVICTAMLALSVGLPLLVNYERWGNPLVFVPFERNVAIQQDLRRVQSIKIYGETNPVRIPLALEYYFIPHRDNFAADIPFLKFSSTLNLKFFTHYFSYIETNQLPLALTSLFFTGAFMLGLFAVLGPSAAPNYEIRPREILLCFCLALPAYLVLSFTATSQRYQSDFFPLLFAVGLYSTGIRSRPIFKKPLVIGASLVCSVSILCGVMASLHMKLFASTLTNEQIAYWRQILASLKSIF